MLAWFHKLPLYSINSFNGLWAAFISHYLFSVQQKRNISSLQTILKQEEESIHDLKKRFGQVVQQIELYSIDVVLQNFRRSFGPSTPFFQSLFLKPLTMMKELHRRVDRYSMLDDNIRPMAQIFMITCQLAEGNDPPGKKPSKSKEGHNRDWNRSRDQSQKKRAPIIYLPERPL